MQYKKPCQKHIPDTDRLCYFLIVLRGRRQGSRLWKFASQEITCDDPGEILKLKEGTWRYYSENGVLEKTETYDYKKDFWSSVPEE